nr:MAG TPA: hypothetical protein [Caudoviricetes sp.]
MLYSPSYFSVGDNILRLLKKKEGRQARVCH